MTKLKEAFYLFCGNDEMRPIMLNPFILGDYTYATDAYTIIRCKNQIIDFEFENNHKPLEAEKVYPSNNMSEFLDLNSINWESFMNEDDTIGDGKDVDCGHCDGQGSCDEIFSYKGKFYIYEYECPVCDGSGLEEEEKQIPTGKKTFSINAMVKLKNVYFYASKFYKVIKVANILNEKIELVYLAESNKPACFNIGNCQVLIMPCMSNDDNDVIVNL